ncbi:MAG: hypothetical protein JW787_04210 [Sedimentisphaerales bacterium]|nr:hypothetical protein [Sedimentisphaerales bacterium]
MIKNSFSRSLKVIFFVTFIAIAASLTFRAVAANEPAAPTAREKSEDTIDKTGWKPIEVNLPTAMFVGTPQDIVVEKLEKPLGKPRPPFLAPPGTKLVSLGKPITSSDNDPIIGRLKYITDGDKEASDGCFVELMPLKQHVTIDLGKEYEIWAIIVWHYHLQPRVYFDVIVQVASDPDFLTDVKTIFNNDIDNSYGLGIGKNLHYIETNEGKLIEGNGVKGRYVRLHSNKNSNDDMNHYIEVSVYGKELESK